ncbi:MAG TPA: RNA polymerase factor sigma-54 [Nevskiaceae bacterium]|nr:RNA polymerase factor sigma-54 [Nevskiaceae bacterium]
MQPALHAQLGHQMALTPQLLQSIRLLQLSALELEQEMREALERNLMLEVEEDAESEDPEARDWSAAEPAAEADVAEPLAAVSGCDAGAVSEVEADFDWSSRESWSGGEPTDEDGESWEARTPASGPTDTRLQVLAQLEPQFRDARQRRLVEHLLDAIDDAGYLTRSCLELSEELQAEGLAVSSEELEQALALIHSAEPCGYGARSLSECLLLQLGSLPPRTRGLRLARQLAAEGLGELGFGQPEDLARLREEWGVSREQLRAAIALLLALDPKPGARHAAPAEAVVPDVIVSGRPGAWRVQLNQDRLPRLRVNRLYERALASGASHRGLKDQLQEARWLVRGLEMRHDTLIRTAQAIFERQAGFLARGEEAMVRLTLKEIALQIGMHESTVCRITQNKYVATPWGLYEMKAFFPSEIRGTEGTVSGTGVKAMIRRIIDGERASDPLCDGAITAILLRSGIKLARRTVAKYREAMKIPPAAERGVQAARIGRTARWSA